MECGGPSASVQCLRVDYCVIWGVCVLVTVYTDVRDVITRNCAINRLTRRTAGLLFTASRHDSVYWGCSIKLGCINITMSSRWLPFTRATVWKLIVILLTISNAVLRTRRLFYVIVPKQIWVTFNRCVSIGAYSNFMFLDFERTVPFKNDPDSGFVSLNGVPFKDHYLVSYLNPLTGAE